MEANTLVERREAGDALGQVQYRLTGDGLALDATLRHIEAAPAAPPADRQRLT